MMNVENFVNFVNLVVDLVVVAEANFKFEDEFELLNELLFHLILLN